MPRKTFDVASLLDRTNDVLANDVFSVEYKRGAIDALVYVLHATGQYAGFGYIDGYDAEDPEFAIGGRKDVRRKYFLARKAS